MCRTGAAEDTLRKQKKKFRLIKRREKSKNVFEFLEPLYRISLRKQKKNSNMVMIKCLMKN